MSKYIDPTNKLMGHLDRLAAIQAGDHPAPVNVEIDLTNRCNLGCDGCHFGHVHTRGPLAVRHTHEAGDTFDYPLIDNVLQQLNVSGVRSITWTGGGEPTLYKYFDAVIEDCPLPQGIYTNGTLIDEQRADLLRRRCDWVYVSMDNHTRESYQLYKRADKFEAACNGVRFLRECEGNATIGIGYLIGADNWQDIPAMVDHGLGLGADYVNFRPMIEFDKIHLSHLAQPVDWVDEVVELMDYYAGNAQVIADSSRFEMLRDWKTHPYPTCYWAQVQTVITPDARVWTCVNRRGFNGDALGDLHLESFPSIWRRSKAHKVDNKCRVMCRGHIPNLALNAMMEPRKHAEFI